MHAVKEQLSRILPYGLTGRVSRIVGLTASVVGFPAPLGAVCRISREHGKPVDAEVIGFHGNETILMPYGDLSGIRRANRVSLIESVPGVRVGEQLLGRVIDARGRFIDGMPAAVLPHRANLHAAPTSPLDRPRIDAPLGTGVRVIDGLLSCGKGQRLGIFAGSGVGKSVLLGQMAQSSSADINVVVLVGERGREVREFLERNLGAEGLKRSVVIVATSDEPALLRLRAAHAGTAIAEYFRDSGRNVLLMMDSVTRFALAQREIGLAAGEPPATRGYPPSVFAALPRLLERSGRNDRGSITGFYTVLVEADDANEPISDTVRGILDGHIFLSRQLAERSHWPAIDVLSSISRSMNDIVGDEHRQAADSLKRLMSAYQQSEDLISIGAYQAGSNPTVDLAIQLRERIDAFLQQEASERVTFSEVVDDLMKFNHLREGLAGQSQSAANSPQNNTNEAG
ncbi:MAG: FliI/YscN family ATPase [Planctomycetaceae bacterium]|jgi:flagellum-specific ATP synthase|nr:FliI/YscN family ATPase [Planctomycetaceae bacterium]MBT6483454.1 FliI/YscN family ATPase [Planctomycetaceae bacterium]